MGEFVVKRSDDGGFIFNLIASNGRIICTSQSYASLSSAKNGIESIRKNVGSEIENQASKDYEAKKIRNGRSTPTKRGSSDSGSTLRMGNPSYPVKDTKPSPTQKKKASDPSAETPRTQR